MYAVNVTISAKDEKKLKRIDKERWKSWSWYKWKENKVYDTIQKISKEKRS